VSFGQIYAYVRFSGLFFEKIQFRDALFRLRYLIFGEVRRENKEEEFDKHEFSDLFCLLSKN
jgi:hypothetical protein